MMTFWVLGDASDKSPFHATLNDEHTLVLKLQCNALNHPRYKER